MTGGALLTAAEGRRWSKPPGCPGCCTSPRHCALSVRVGAACGENQPGPCKATRFARSVPR